MVITLTPIKRYKRLLTSAHVFALCIFIICRVYVARLVFVFCFICLSRAYFSFVYDVPRRLKEAQFISLIGFNDNTVILKDARKSGKFSEVQIRNKNLRYLTDENSPDCIHVGFALALPEVRKALNH